MEIDGEQKSTQIRLSRFPAGFRLPLTTARRCGGNAGNAPGRSVDGAGVAIPEGGHAGESSTKVAAEHVYS